VDHAVSAFYIRSNHMSPFAALLAVALHAGVALAAWSLAPLNTRDLDDNAIEITMEEPTNRQEMPPPAPETVRPPLSPAPSLAEQATAPPPPQPPPEAAPQPEHQPAPQSAIEPREQLGLPPDPPEADPGIEPTKPVAQVPERKPDTESEPKLEPELDRPAKSTQPEPALESKPEPQQQAAVAPPPEPPPPPPAPQATLEESIPPVEPPPAPLTTRDFVKVLPPPPPPPRPAPVPQRPPPQHQAPPALQHSPLSTAPSRPQQERSGAAASTFVNPATDAAQTRAKNDYLWHVVRKFSQYLPDLRQKNEGGTVVLRFVIARDGRLVDASVVKSSGVIALDRGLLESLRAASPYPPLPAEISGNQVTFTQPIAAARR